MNEESKLAALLELAESMELSIRLAPAGFLGDQAGAYVRLRGEEVLFLDATAALTDQIACVAETLARFERIDDMFIPPALREVIEEAKKDST